MRTRTMFCLAHLATESTEVGMCEVEYLSGEDPSACRIVPAWITWKANDRDPCACGHSRGFHWREGAACTFAACRCLRFDA